MTDSQNSIWNSFAVLYAKLESNAIITVLLSATDFVPLYKKLIIDIHITTNEYDV